MRSIWMEETKLPHFASMPDKARADVIVIGGGMAGLLTAYYLTKRGKHVIVLEAEEIATGQTCFTTAKITSQHNLIYARLLSKLGLKKAKAYAMANQNAVIEYRRLIEEEQIECHFEEVPSYLYSRHLTKPLEEEARAAAKLGLPSSFTAETKLPFDVAGAVRFDGQAIFHPLEFIRALCGRLEIYEHTKVRSVRENVVNTDHGAATADDIVFACHYPFINIPGFFFTKMYQERSYVLALKNAARLRGIYLGIDDDGLSIRPAGDALILGGGSHRTGKSQGQSPYAMLEKAARTYWKDSEEIGRWSAQDCMSVDRIPYIGRFSSFTPHWYVATGFNKWGMSSSMVSALLITSLITGAESIYQDVFSPQRVNVSLSAKETLLHALESSAGLTLGILPGARRCPHLGCALSWNQTEEFWECRCHGSRFGGDGKLLNGPAQEDASLIE